MSKSILRKRKPTLLAWIVILAQLLALTTTGLATALQPTPEIARSAAHDLGLVGWFADSLAWLTGQTQPLLGAPETALAQATGVVLPEYLGSDVAFNASGATVSTFTIPAGATHARVSGWTGNQGGGFIPSEEDWFSTEAWIDLAASTLSGNVVNGAGGASRDNYVFSNVPFGTNVSSGASGVVDGLYAYSVSVAGSTLTWTESVDRGMPLLVEFYRAGTSMRALGASAAAFAIGDASKTVAVPANTDIVVITAAFADNTGTNTEEDHKNVRMVLDLNANTLAGRAAAVLGGTTSDVQAYVFENLPANAAYGGTATPSSGTATGDLTIPTSPAFAYDSDVYVSGGVLTINHVPAASGISTGVEGAYLVEFYERDAAAAPAYLGTTNFTTVSSAPLSFAIPAGAQYGLLRAGGLVVAGNSDEDWSEVVAVIDLVNSASHGNNGFFDGGTVRGHGWHDVPLGADIQGHANAVAVGAPQAFTITKSGSNLTITALHPSAAGSVHWFGVNDTDADGIINITDLDDDNDGILDEAEGARPNLWFHIQDNNNTIIYRVSKGDGTFTNCPTTAGPGGNYSGTNNAESAFFADVTGDGLKDLVHGIDSPNSGIQVWPGMGNGSYGSVITTPGLTGDWAGTAGDQSTFLADATGDGILDWINGNDARAGDTLLVYAGLGNGTFNTTPIVTNSMTGDWAGTDAAQSAFLIDVTGDGRVDWITGRDGGPYVPVNVYSGLAGGLFATTPAVTSNLTGDWSGTDLAQSTFLEDVTGDGLPDWVSGRDSSPYVPISVFRNLGGGSFETTPSITSSPTGDWGGTFNIQSTFLGDVNNDLILDWVTGYDTTNFLNTFLGNGDGTFQTTPIASGGASGDWAGTDNLQSTFLERDVFATGYTLDASCNVVLVDADGDGIPNYLDLDSDNDGIPDNIEAQTTAGYVVPGTAVDAQGRLTAYGAAGLTPVNTDNSDTPDYIDTDSDNAQGNDTAEAGLTLGAFDDPDGDGLDNDVDTNDSAFGPVNAGITNPGATYPNTINGTGDVDYRDPTSVATASVDKKFSTDGVIFSDNITVTQGSTLTERIYYNNTGSSAGLAAAIQATLPAGFTLVANSTKNCLNPTPGETVCNTAAGQGGALNEGAVWSGQTLTIAPTAGLYGEPVGATSGRLEVGKKRYFNLQECEYLNPAPAADDVEHWVAGTQTNVSNTAGTTGTCTNVGVDVRESATSAMRAMDLLGRRYVNLHECQYFNPAPAADDVNHYVPGTQTNSSNNADTTGTCTNVGVDVRESATTSAVRALDLRDNRYINLHECQYFNPAPAADDVDYLVSGTQTNASNTPDSSGTCVATGVDVPESPTTTAVLALDTLDTARGTGYIEFKMTANDAGTFTQNASLSGSNLTTITDTGNLTVVGIPDLTTSIGQPSPSFVAGVASNVPLTVTNSGSAATTGTITATMTLPAGTSAPASFTSGPWTCSTSGQTMTCTQPGPIPAGGSSTIQVPVTPGAGTAGTTPGPFTGTTSTPGETNTGNNPATPMTPTTPVAPAPVSMVSVPAKVILGGAYNASSLLMRDDLRSLNLIPTTSPYASAPATTNASIFAVTGNDAIVDWVLVEVRASATPATVVASKSAFVQRDGDVVDADGVSPLSISGPSAGNYHVAVRHRNHLGVMTANPVALSGSTAPIDFTAGGAYGTQAQKQVGSVFALWTGDVNGDNSSIVTGPGNDKSLILAAVLSAPGNTTQNQNYMVTAYSASDLNLDGRVLAAGPNNDINNLYSIIFTHPANTTFAANYVVQGQVP